MEAVARQRDRKQNVTAVGEKLRVTLILNFRSLCVYLLSTGISDKPVQKLRTAGREGTPGSEYPVFDCSEAPGVISACGVQQPILTIPSPRYPCSEESKELLCGWI
ncbi:hypothetical protein STEG23_006660 [Scotinomys teguina]